MAPAYNRLRETTFDLFVERDALPAYYRFAALVASWLVVIGYILFALSASMPADALLASNYVLAAIGGILLLVGYLTIAILAFVGRSLLFTIDCALFPTVTASLSGFFITVLTYSLHKAHPVPRIYAIIPLSAACGTTLLSALFLWYTYRRIGNIRKTDERRRWHVPKPYGSSPQGRWPQPPAGGPEDEAQRKQLARLLDARTETSSMENVRGTYQIDLPGERLERGRSSSVPPQQSFGLSDIFSWKKPNIGTFKDARERRREEIERAGISLSAYPQSATSPSGKWHTNTRSRSHSRDPLPERHSPSTWGRSPTLATRYA